MPWIKRRPTGDTTGDGQISTPIQVFRIWGVSKAAVEQTPGDILGGGEHGYGAEPLPSYGDTHPDYVGSPPPRLDTIEVVSISANVFDATFRYSSDGRFRLRRTVVLPDEFLHYGGSSSMVEVEIPFARREYTYRAPEPGQPAEAPSGYWSRDAMVLTSPMALRTAKIRVPGSAFGPQPHSVRNLIDREVNRIHKLEFEDGSSIHAEFLGWNHAQVGPDLFELTYRWGIDGGTPLVLLEDGPDGPPERRVVGGEQIVRPREHWPRPGTPGPFGTGIPPGGFPSYDEPDGFLRPPFHSLQLRLPDDYELGYPTWYAQPIAFKGDATAVQAWKQFPGLL